MLKNLHLVIFLGLIWSLPTFALDKDSLKIEISSLQKLFSEDMEASFRKTQNLLNEEALINDANAILQIREIRCKYYYIKNNINDLYDEATELKQKAEKQNNLYFIAMSNIYLAEVYSRNALPDKAISLLNDNLKLLKKVDNKLSKLFIAKINTLTSFGNLYNDLGDYKKSANYIKQIIYSYEKLDNKEQLSKVKYVNYSNLASTYYYIDLDSAKYFAEQSNLYKNEKDIIYINNLLIIGKVQKSKQQYIEALENLEEAYHYSELHGGFLNLEDLLNTLLEIYKSENRLDDVKKIENKLITHQMTVLKNQNKSLLKIISDSEKNKMPILHYFLIIFIPISLTVVTYVIINTIRKKSTYNSEVIIPTYEKLLEILKNNEAEFLPYFEIAYPEFRIKLLSINDTLGNSEIEFCALLKMNLSTKEIAQLQYLEIRTIQNKKYRIRKKLGITPQEDLYNWISINT